MFWFIVLLLVVGAGFYFYQKLIAIEREIHAEQKEYNAALQKAEKSPQDISAANDSDSGNTAVDLTSEGDAPISLEEAILAEINKQAGIKQTDLYPMFSATNKKQLQKLIKVLADSGKLRREKQGSSYLLYPL